MRNRGRGQILPIAIACLVVLTAMVPLMVFYTQRDARWAVKQAANTTAFHLAESGLEKAVLFMSLSTETWNNIQTGGATAAASLTNYSMDKAYADIAGGTYAISITSGPLDQQATVIVVGRDRFTREYRGLKAVYTNSPLGDTAIFAGRGAQIGGGVNVEWGAVMSPYTVDSAGRDWPQFWSASQIIGKDANATPPNCDSPSCCQWHSFYADIPAAPAINFDFYRSSAQTNASGGCPAGGTNCYYTGSVTNWDHTTTGTVFIEGNLTIKSPGMFHTGDMVVMGNVNLPNGVWGRGTVNMAIPPDAWKQYCIPAAWTHYRTTFDSAAPATFPGLEGTHTSACTVAGGCTSTKISVAGMLYVGGNFNNGGGGGGNSDIYGALYVVGSATQTAASTVNFFYNAGAGTGLQTTTVVLNRASWQNVLYPWPPALP